MDDDGVGSIVRSEDERKKLAAQSRNAECSECGYKAMNLVEIASLTEPSSKTRKVCAKAEQKVAPSSVKQPIRRSTRKRKQPC